MAFELMTLEELKILGINGQNDKKLNLETGVFSKSRWAFESVEQKTDNSQNIRIYMKQGLSIYLISDKSENITSRYRFYKISENEIPDGAIADENGVYFVTENDEYIVLGE